MKFEPGKFFIGIIDFFAVLLPGALLTYFIKDYGYRLIFGEKLSTLNDTEQWVIFLFLSYVLGHFIFLIGSAFLDEYVYDFLRKRTYVNEARRIAKGKKLRPKFLRFIASKSFNTYMEPSLQKVLQIKALHLDRVDATSTLNAFKWCKIRLQLTATEALEPIERFEANSKFFRSFFVVLVILLPVSLFQGLWFLSLGILLLMLLALWRYIDQRKKAVQQAYWSIISQEAENAQESQSHPLAKSKKQLQAGGVVIKRIGKEERYLLVRSKNNQEWVLPKGKVDPGESLEQTAIREVKEETGVWASIEAPLGKIKFEFQGEKVRVNFFKMSFLEKGKSHDKPRREIKWAAFSEAIPLLREESREILAKSKESVPSA